MNSSPSSQLAAPFSMPFKIALATAAASNPNKLSLKSAERCLLCYLLQRVSVSDPRTPFRCRVDRLAAEFEVTTRSVHNWLVGLRESGLLGFKQRRNKFGSFGLAAVLTDKAIEVLWMNETPTPQFKSSRENGQIRPFVKNISDTEIPDNNLINNQPEGQFLKTPKGTLPPDVQVLSATHGLTDPTVFWLMKQASNKSNRLGSILKVASKYLDGKTPGAIKAYLIKCINSGRDYDAAPCYEQTTTKKVSPQAMLRCLSDAVNANGGAIKMRAGSVLTIEHGMLVRCIEDSKGRLEAAGIIAGDMVAVLYQRWKDKKSLD